jgi:hypothetical protein
LNNKCKRYKRNKKTEKEKEEKKRKYENGPGERFGPAPEEAHGPASPTESVPSVLSFPR